MKYFVSNKRPELEFFMQMQEHLLQDEKPSKYFNSVFDNRLMESYPFSMLRMLKTTEQSPEHHPEGNVWNHTMLVVDEAARIKAKSKNPEIFMMAALLHDLGKPATTRFRKGKYTAYNHDKVGAKLCRAFLECFTDDIDLNEASTAIIRGVSKQSCNSGGIRSVPKGAKSNRVFIEEVTQLVRYHMQILFVVKNMPFADIKGLMKNTDFHEVALLGLCDRLGRTKGNREEEQENIQKFIEICKAYTNLK